MSPCMRICFLWQQDTPEGWSLLDNDLETWQSTYSWKVEQEEEEEDNLSPPLASSTSSSILILGQSCKLAGLFCPRWPVVNLAVQQQAAPWLRRTGTTARGLAQSRSGGVHAVQYVPWKIERWQTSSADVCWVVGGRVVCSSNLAIVWTVSLDDSLVLFRGASHTNESLGEIRIASR